LIFLTNDFENTAQVIADIYKARWDIELFLKNHQAEPKIKRFFGTTRNAVLTQVWLVMIAYLIHQFLQISA
jgi:IS4 transposase